MFLFPVEDPSVAPGPTYLHSRPVTQKINNDLCIFTFLMTMSNSVSTSPSVDGTRDIMTYMSHTETQHSVHQSSQT